MELGHLRVFYHVARAGSFSAAAKYLRISQPALSKTVKLLEAAQGVVLFERGKRGVRLTKVGQILFESCGRIFREIEITRVRLTEEQRELSGTVHFGASNSICNYLLPPWIKEFGTEHPKLNFSLVNGTTTMLVSRVEEGNIEFAMGHWPTKEKRFLCERIVSASFSIVVSSKNAMLKKYGPSIEILDELPRIRPRVAEYSRNLPITSALEKMGVKYSRYIECNSPETQKNMVVLDYGYAVVPSYMVREEIESGQFTQIDPPEPIGTGIYLISKKANTLLPHAEQFKTYVKKKIIDYFEA